jgi:hypothetical protein
MAEPLTPSVGPRIVTIESLPSQPPSEAHPGTEAWTASGSLAAARFEQMRERLRGETANVGRGVMVTVRDREVSRLQTELARRASSERPLPAGGMEVKFGTGFEGGDWFGWLFSVLDWVDRRDAHPLVRPKTTEAEVIPDRARIAMTGDWGTGLYGAPRFAHRIRATAPYDILLHLGDVYYSGTTDEMQRRFLDVWPFDAGARTRALNSNHEMYSGGFGYFGLLLPHIGQESSYFAFENTNWLLVGLDTAYVDHDIDTEQAAWLDLVIARAARRGTRKKLVLFSHQQLFSAFDEDGGRLQRALRHLLEARGITAWYWGHEHRAIVYDPHPRHGMHARCLGNGGIPQPRTGDVRNAPVELTVGRDVTWRRFPASGDRPSCLVLDGPNPDVHGDEERFGPHGYMTLELDGPVIVERVFLSDGTEVLSRTIG